MRPPCLFLSLLLGLVACGDKDVDYIPTDDTGGSGSGDEGGDDTGSGSGDEGTDEDGDGWTVEEGDCDDDDIWVNPAWDEDTSDGKDNDCDGLIDEQFAGMDVARQYVYGRSDILRIDTVSRVEDEISLDDGYAPQDITSGLNGGWAITHDDDPSTAPAFEVELNEGAAVVEVGEDGSCTTLASFTPDETEEGYLAGLAGIDDNPVIRGLVTHPDGYYLTARPGALVKVEADGSTEDVATWVYDFSADPDGYELYAMDLAVDGVTGEVAIAGLLGGFATWDPDTGLTLLRAADLSGSWENWDYSILAAVASKHGGGWYSLHIDYSTGIYSLSRFNLEQGEWVERMTWEESLILPAKLMVNGDNGDVYVTANAGYYHMIFLMRETQDLADDYYNSGTDENGWFFRGLIGRY